MDDTRRANDRVESTNEADGATVDDTDVTIPVEPENETIANVDESVERAGW